PAPPPAAVAPAAPAPALVAAPTPATAPAAPATPPPAAPNLAPPQLNGNWSGDSGDPNLPVSFEVIDNQVTSMSASYSGKNGACSFNGSVNSEGPALISGNSFVAKGKSPREEIYFT